MGSPYRIPFLRILLLASANILHRTIYFYLCKDKLMKLKEKNPGRVLWRQAQTLQTVYETFSGHCVK